jgi:hypothetical protein
MFTSALSAAKTIVVKNNICEFADLSDIKVKIVQDGVLWTDRQLGHLVMKHILLTPCSTTTNRSLNH